jgi:hypothetical protein
MGKLRFYRYFSTSTGPQDIHLIPPRRTKFEIEDDDPMTVAPAPPEPLQSSDPDLVQFEFDVPDLKWRLSVSSAVGVNLPADQPDSLDLVFSEKTLHTLYAKLGELLNIVEKGIPQSLIRLKPGLYRFIFLPAGEERARVAERTVERMSQYSARIVPEGEMYRIVLPEDQRQRMLEDRKKFEQAQQRYRETRSRWIVENNHHPTLERQEDGSYVLKLPGPIPESVVQGWDELMRDAWDRIKPDQPQGP